MPNTDYALPHETTIKEGMELLVIGSPGLPIFYSNNKAKVAWEKTFLGKMVKVLEPEDYKEGLVRVKLVHGGNITYVHKSLLLDLEVMV
jgi:hypothetical protein